jgi:hypothetical protein
MAAAGLDARFGADLDFDADFATLGLVFLIANDGQKRRIKPAKSQTGFAGAGSSALQFEIQALMTVAPAAGRETKIVASIFVFFL